MGKNERIVYINGTLLPESEAKISIFDIGFKYGAVFYEAMRTFNHRIFKLEKHLKRLENSLKYVGLDRLVKIDKIESIINEVFNANIRFTEKDDDIFICIEITPGIGLPHPLMKQEILSPTIICYISSIPYKAYAKYYTTGVNCVIVDICNIPPQCFNPKIKNRSRLHFYIAKKQAETIDPEAFALLLDIDGYLTESTGANFFIVKNGVLYTPTKKN
ncbi:MAG: aminotransferase class IV, partial [Candidatus Omnitrophica bacterium]|nr:aminotransferase class IV [Candidatus Omnitrophota bacterium]